MIKLLERHSNAISAFSAIVTACVAAGALIGVKFQLDEAERLQHAQSARTAFRTHLELAVQHPDFAHPENACSLLNSAQAPSYQAFVEHLLYSAEQMLHVADNWEDTFLGYLKPHAAYLCSKDSLSAETEYTASLHTQFRADSCDALPAC